MQYNQLNKLS